MTSGPQRLAALAMILALAAEAGVGCRPASSALGDVEKIGTLAITEGQLSESVEISEKQ